MSRVNKADLNELAARLGLAIESYNPGDGRRYKIVLDGQDYFATDGFFRSTSLRECAIWLAGFAEAKPEYLTKIYFDKHGAA